MKDYFYESDSFARRLAKSLEIAKKQRRGVPEAIATVLWVQVLKVRHECHSKYALERLFEPVAFGRNKDGVIYHRNKWSRYEVGLSTPSKVLVNRVEGISPGSARVLNHPLWKLLNCKQWNPDEFDAWLMQLSLEIQTVLADRRSASPFSDILCKKLNGTQINMLERRISLDALAATTIFLLKAIGLGDKKDAFKLGQSLYRMLLIVCGFTPLIYFASIIFGLFRSKIFPLVEYDEICFDFENFDFAEAVKMLNRTMLRLEDQGLVNDFSDSMSIKTQLLLLKGRFGFDVMHAMKPPLKLCKPRSALNKIQYEFCERYECERAWGCSILRSGRHEKFPPF